MQQVAARGHLLVRVHTERALLEAQTLNLHMFLQIFSGFVASMLCASDLRHRENLFKIYIP